MAHSSALHPGQLHAPPARAPEATPERAKKPHRVSRTGDALSLAGDLSTANAEAINAELRRKTGRPKGSLRIDLSGVKRIDGGVVSILERVRAELSARRVTTTLTGASDDVRTVLELYGARLEVAPKAPRRRTQEGLVARLGAAALAGATELRAAVAFVGELAVDVAGIVRHPKSGNLRDLLPLIEKSGFDAIPIVLVINMLVGFVMGFQSARQLETYGANVFVADIVGLAVVRELAPLITAIVVCGRSGAAFAAEIGTMKVNEEIDALRVMGLGPVRYLVVPRVLALLATVPLLTLASDVVGVFGGLVVGMTSLGVGPGAYISELRTAVLPWDVLSGLIKSVAFAVAIALIGCQQGFATHGGATGVGRRTTTTVVATIFALVLIDVAFTAFFRSVSR